MPATSSRASRARAARTATSRAVCRAWPSCSRRASPRTSRSSATIAGRIEFGKDYKNKRRILIVPEGEGAEPVEYLIPKGKRIAVQEGDFVERGDLLIDGNPVPHDILRVLGIEKLAEYLVNEIQEVYRLQGVKINDKHIETIARQMLQKVEITDAGDSTFLIGEQVDKQEYEQENAKLIVREAEAGQGRPGAARHHQGVAADQVVHLGGLLPGDHPRADRGGRRRAASTPCRASRRTSSSAA